MLPKIDLDLAKKVLLVVDAGLSNGLGSPEPGHMCVEAAVNFAMGLPHGDAPPCVAPVLRELKIKINDWRWSSYAIRARALRRLAVAQLGSVDVLDVVLFAEEVQRLAIAYAVPTALEADTLDAGWTAEQVSTAKRLAALCRSTPNKSSLTEVEGWARGISERVAGWVLDAVEYARPLDVDSSCSAAFAAAKAVYWRRGNDYPQREAAETFMATFAEGVVQILVKMNLPGIEFLTLTDPVPVPEGWTA